MTDLTQSPKDQASDIDDAVVIDETTLSPDATDTADIKEDAHKQDKPAKTGLLWLFTVFNFIIIALICAAGYWYYTQIAGGESDKQTDIIALQQDISTFQQDISEQSRSFRSDVSQLKQSTQNLESNIANVKQTSSQNLANVENKLAQDLANAQNKLSQDLASMRNEVAQATGSANALNKRVAEMSGRRPSDWLLAEANYLVNMAGRKLYLEKDIRTAMTLLKEADDRLNDLDDPSLFPVRALISSDIQALAQVNPVSTNSIALAIAGMLPKVGELPLDTLQLPENLNQQDLTLSGDVNDWRENLKKTWRAVVNDLISIDYVDQPLEPYLAQRQQWLIEQQLNYALTQAQTAALNEHVELYRSSTQRAIGLLVEHYKMDSIQVSQFLVALQELQNIDFSRKYPNSLASQASLKGIIKQRIDGLYNNSNMREDESLGNQL